MLETCRECFYNKREMNDNNNSRTCTLWIFKMTVLSAMYTKCDSFKYEKDKYEKE